MNDRRKEVLLRAAFEFAASLGHVFNLAVKLGSRFERIPDVGIGSCLRKAIHRGRIFDNMRAKQGRTSSRFYAKETCTGSKIYD